MINIEKAKKYYREYVSKYNLTDSKIVLEIEHIYNTAENAKWLAEKIKLSEEDIKLAELVGLLHNIGKFEQIKEYTTLIDKDSIDHAEYGVQILFKEGLIRSFIDTEKYNQIIRTAILNHNKPRIENIYNDRELLHCRIIRDADKLDIFNAVLENDLETTYPLKDYTKEKVSKVVKEEFKTKRVVTYKNMKSCADLVAMQIALVFDINYIYSLEEIVKENYLERLIKRFEAKDEETIKDLNELKDIAQKYIQDKIEEGEICLKNY